MKRALKSNGYPSLPIVRQNLAVTDSAVDKITGSSKIGLTSRMDKKLSPALAPFTYIIGK